MLFFSITDNKPALNNVFSINSSTGIITVNAIGENLITEGVNSGVLQVSQEHTIKDVISLLRQQQDYD